MMAYCYLCKREMSAEEMRELGSNVEPGTSWVPVCQECGQRRGRKPSPVDYRELLRKYIMLVQVEEGCTFLEHEVPRRIGPDTVMSEDDLEKLHDIALLAWYELVQNEGVNV